MDRRPRGPNVAPLLGGPDGGVSRPVVPDGGEPSTDEPEGEALGDEKLPALAKAVLVHGPEAVTGDDLQGVEV